MSEVKIQATIFQLRNQEQDRESEERHGEQIQDTDIDKARSDRDDIPAIIDAPCDGVQEPEEDEVAGEDEVGLGDVETLGGCEAAGEEGGGEEEVGEGAEDEEAPFVGCGYEGAGEPGGYPDPSQGDVEDDGCPGDARDETDGQDERRPAYEPRLC